MLADGSVGYADKSHESSAAAHRIDTLGSARITIEHQCGLGDFSEMSGHMPARKASAQLRRDTRCGNICAHIGACRK